MPIPSAIIAVVDDDVAVLRSLGRLVQSLRFEPRLFSSGEAFLQSLTKERPDCAILDVNMPGLTGVDVLQKLRAIGDRLPVIVISGLEDPGVRYICADTAATSFIAKPIERAALDKAIGDLIRRGH